MYIIFTQHKDHDSKLFFFSNFNFLCFFSLIWAKRERVATNKHVIDNNHKTELFHFCFLWRAFEFISDDNRNHRQLSSFKKMESSIRKSIECVSFKTIDASVFWGSIQHMFSIITFFLNNGDWLLQNISHDGSDYGPCFFENTKMMTTVPIFLHSTRSCCLLNTLLAS